MTHPLTPREKVAQTIIYNPVYGKLWEGSDPTRGYIYHLASSSGDHAELAELREHRITADLLVSSLKADKAEAERKLAEAVGLNDRAAELMRQCTDPERFEGASTLNVYANMRAWLSDLSKEAERG